MVTAVRMVRRVLQERGWTQADLVRRMRRVLATEPASVSRWVNGLQVPNHPSANAIERLLGVPVRAGGEEDRSDAAPIKHIGSVQIRNLGKRGGILCNVNPCAVFSCGSK